MTWLSQLFLQSGFLWGTLLVSAPILIYIFNRRRYRRRSWAAMSFLLQAVQKNRRRLRIENLILLFIRCAIIALLALAMARPFVRSDALGPVAQGPANWIFAIDTSYSMNTRRGGQSLFEQARESTARMVQEVLSSGDRFAVVSFGADPRELIAPVSVTGENRNDLLDELERLEPGYRGVDIVASLQAVLETAGNFRKIGGDEVALQAKRLVVFSDFQRKD